jgi:hypothetical protein
VFTGLAYVQHLLGRGLALWGFDRRLGLGHNRLAADLGRAAGQQSDNRGDNNEDESPQRATLPVLRM